MKIPSLKQAFGLAGAATAALVGENAAVGLEAANALFDKLTAPKADKPATL